MAGRRIHETGSHATSETADNRGRFCNVGRIIEGKRQNERHRAVYASVCAVQPLCANDFVDKLNYFGEGNDTTLAGASLFGMTQTIVGANAIKPVYEWSAIRKLNLALLGEINGRFVSIRG